MRIELLSDGKPKTLNSAYTNVWIKGPKGWQMVAWQSTPLARMRGQWASPHLSFSSRVWVWAQSYPERPIRFYVGFPPGGSTDLVSRYLGEKLSQRLKQPVAVEQKTGATGLLANDAVAKAPPDGHTMVLLTGGHPGTAAVMKSLPYDPVKDFGMVSVVIEYPMTISVAPESPIQSLPRSHRPREGRAGQDQLLLCRPGQPAPSPRRVDEHRGRHADAARAVQGRGAGVHRAPRRAHRCADRDRDLRLPAHQGEPPAPARALLRRALSADARRADGRRDAEGRRVQLVARPRRLARHAAFLRRNPEQGTEVYPRAGRDARALRRVRRRARAFVARADGGRVEQEVARWKRVVATRGIELQQ